MLGIALRAILVPARGYDDDVRLFMAWGERVAHAGPGGVYAPGFFVDYPPALFYLLWPIAAIFEGEALRLAVKSISNAVVTCADVCFDSTMCWAIFLRMTDSGSRRIFSP